MLKLFVFGLAAIIAGGLALLLPLAAQALAFAATSPAGPLLVLVAILGQVRPAPVRAPVGLLTMSDRAFLAYLLTREVPHGA